MKNSFKNFKQFFQLDALFFLRVGIVLVALAGASSIMGWEGWSGNLAIFAFFALGVGVLMQVLELRFKVSPITWITDKLEKSFGVVGSFYFRIGVVLFVGVAVWLKDVLGAQGALIDGIFGRVLVWYNQGLVGQFVSGQNLIRLEKLGLLFSFWLAIFLALIIGLKIFWLTQAFIKQCPKTISFRLTVISLRDWTVGLAFIGFLAYLTLVYFPPKTYFLNELISLKVLGRLAPYNQLKIMMLWRGLSVILLGLVGWLIFFPLGQKKGLRRNEARPFAIQTDRLVNGVFIVVAFAIFYQGFLVLNEQKNHLNFHPISPTFFLVDASLPKDLKAQVVWFPDYQYGVVQRKTKNKKLLADAYLSKNRSFGLKNKQKETLKYLWWQVFYGKQNDYSDLLKQEKIRFIVYFKNQGPTSLEQDLILKGLESKKYLTLFSKTSGHVIYEFKDWRKSPVLARNYQLDGLKELEPLFSRKPKMPIVGGVNPDFMDKEIVNGEEKIIVFPNRMKEGDWLVVGSQKFKVDKQKKYLLGVDWKSHGTGSLHILINLYRDTKEHKDDMFELYKLLVAGGKTNNFDWRKQWTSFETPENVKEVNFNFYFLPNPNRQTSWSIRNLQVISVQDFAGIK